MGVALLIFPNSKAYRELWDRNVPYFRSLDQGYEFLTTFKVEKDGEQKEKCLNKADKGFDEVFQVLKSNSDKLKDISAQQITNRREFALTDGSGNRLNVLSIIFVHSSSSYPPYIAVTSDSELKSWIQNFKKHWMLFASLFFIFCGAVVFLLQGLSVRKLEVRSFVLIVLLLFFVIPVTSFLYGALSWKDLLGYIWIIPITIVALFQDQTKRWLFAPKIELEFKLAGPYCLKSKVWKQSSPQSAVIAMPAYYFRFRIKNSGKTQANLCECVIEELWFKQKDQWQQDLTFQPINLNWSNGKAKDEFLNVNPQCPGWFCDLVHVEKGHYHEVPSDMYQTTHEAVIKADLAFDYLQPFPNSQYHVLQPNVKHQVKVAIYSENALPVKHTFEIVWSGTWKDNAEDMFKEVKIDLL